MARWNNAARVYKVENDDVTLAHELVHKSEQSGMFNTDDVWDITFSPDGKYLAVGFSKFEIQLWDWATKAKLKMVKGCAYTESDLLCVKTGFSPDS